MKAVKKTSSGAGKGVVALLAIIGILFLGVFWYTSIYNDLVRREEGVKSAWGQVQNQYQRRLDLVPNLVETVKGYAAHESETLEAVTKARAQATTALKPEAINDPAKFDQLVASNAAFSSALSRLLLVVEKYPELKANENFLMLQAQIEGTENRVSVERRRFNEAAQEYNRSLRVLPNNFVANITGFKEKEYFRSEEAAATAPAVSFQK